MTAPATTLVWAESMDPSDVVDFVVDCSALLQTNETVASYTLVPYAESVALGLTLGTGSYASSLDSATSTQITMWLSIDPSDVSNTAFDSGATLPINITIVTNSVPPRTKQRTVAVKVAQR